LDPRARVRRVKRCLREVPLELLGCLPGRSGGAVHQVDGPDAPAKVGHRKENTNLIKPATFGLNGRAPGLEGGALPPPRLRHGKLTDGAGRFPGEAAAVLWTPP